MSAHSAFQDKMDVLDVIIAILRDHEEALSKLADRFETISNDMTSFGEKISILEGSQEYSHGSKVESLVEAAGQNGSVVTIKCKDWLTFRSLSHGALLVTFEAAGDDLMLSSVSDLFVFTYSGGFPEVARLMHGRLRKQVPHCPEAGNVERLPLGGFLLEDGSSDCGVALDPTAMKRWLSAELDVPEEKVVEARLLCKL